jgi:hypothetical protein
MIKIDVIKDSEDGEWKNVLYSKWICR